MEFIDIIKHHLPKKE